MKAIVNEPTKLNTDAGLRIDTRNTEELQTELQEKSN